MTSGFVLTLDGICILVNVVITNLINADLVSQVAYLWWMTVMIIDQAKVVSYHNQHFEDDFILVVVEIFGYLHLHLDNFFHRCANITWLMKGSRDLFFQFYIHFIDKRCKWLFKKFKLPLFCRSGSCGNWRSFFSAWCPSRFFAHLLAGLALCQWWWVEVLGFVFSPFRAPHCAFCTFESGLSFGLSVHSFFFSCSLVRCFSKKGKKNPNFTLPYLQVQLLQTPSAIIATI